MQPDSEKDPAVVLSYLLGRKLSADEVYEAFGLKKSTYYDMLGKGTLATADRLIRVARHFQINPVDLLIRYGFLDLEDVAGALGEYGQKPRDSGDKGITYRPRSDRPPWP